MAVLSAMEATPTEVELAECGATSASSWKGKEMTPISPASSVNLMSDAGVAFTLFKANVGMCILYMPRAWRNGGYVLSSLLLPVVAYIFVDCSVRLVKCRLAGAEGGFSDLMERAIGRLGKTLTDISMVGVHGGCCCCYYITVPCLLQAAIPDLAPISINHLIAALFLVWGPLCCIRRVSKLWLCSALGSLMVILGALTTFWLEEQQVERHPPTIHKLNTELQAVDWDSWLIFLGTACFTFEGIGLVVPTYDAARHKDHYVLTLRSIFAVIVFMNWSMGLIGYVVIGADVSPIILVDFTPGPAVVAIQLAFALAIFLSFPLQMVPVFQVLERHSCGIVDPANVPAAEPHRFAFRIMLCAACAVIAVLGATDLDNFVSIIGALCGLPLAIMYPAICHLRIVVGSDATLKEKLPDLLLFLLGLGGTLVITYANIVTWGVA